MFDLGLSLLGIAVLTPVALAVALAIKADDRGSVLFRQVRLGRDGDPFTILKFRTMPHGTPDVESGEAAHLTITRVGRVLRRTSLDEIPQLINVVNGSMSLVGPRPALPSQNELTELRRAKGALVCAPGVTGLAQVDGYDGMPNDEKADIDARYAREQSLCLDVRIILRTCLYVFHPPPRY